MQGQETPEDIPIYRYAGHKEVNILDLLTGSGLVKSKSEARRLVEQGGVEIDGETVNNSQLTINPKNGMILRAGKRKFIKLVVRN